MNEYNVSLEVDGEVICHIINLLAVNVNHRWQQKASEGIYNTNMDNSSGKTQQ